MERIELIESRSVACPHCGETVELAFEADLAGEMVIDCEVCCRPWLVRILRSGTDSELRIGTLDE